MIARRLVVQAEAAALRGRNWRRVFVQPYNFLSSTSNSGTEVGVMVDVRRRPPRASSHTTPPPGGPPPARNEGQLYLKNSICLY